MRTAEEGVERRFMWETSCLGLTSYVYLSCKPAKLSKSSRILPNLKQKIQGEVGDYGEHRRNRACLCTPARTWRCCGKSGIFLGAAARSPTAGGPPGSCPSSSWREDHFATWPTWTTATPAPPWPADGRCRGHALTDAETLTHECV